MSFCRGLGGFKMSRPSCLKPTPSTPSSESPFSRRLTTSSIVASPCPRTTISTNSASSVCLASKEGCQPPRTMGKSLFQAFTARPIAAVSRIIGPVTSDIPRQRASLTSSRTRCFRFGVMVESIRTTLYPALSSGVETARMPSGAVASLLANAGKKNTIFLEPFTLPSPIHLEVPVSSQYGRRIPACNRAACHGTIPFLQKNCQQAARQPEDQPTAPKNGGRAGYKSVLTASELDDVSQQPQYIWRIRSNPMKSPLGVSADGSPRKVARVPARCETTVPGLFENPRVKACLHNRF